MIFNDIDSHLCLCLCIIANNLIRTLYFTCRYKMKFTKSLLALSLTTILTACGGSSNDNTSEPTQPTNSAPTAINISTAAVDENSVAAVIGTLSATDADNNDTHSFSTDNAQFTISGNELRLADGVSFDYETNTSTTVAITATDSAGASYEQTLTINVTDLLDTYTFTSQFEEAASSVSYTGQIARHALIAELNYFIANLEGWLDDNVSATKEDVLAELNKIYFVGANLNDNGDIDENTYDSLEVSFADAKQALISDISSSVKNISQKVAGNDTGGQDINWNTEFAGWGAKGSTTPEELVLTWFDMLADRAVAYNAGTEMASVYVTDEGLDLKQLIQKHLLMAVAFSQSTGDYLGVDTDGKGLTTQNSVGDKDGGKPYTTLEHQFDEGFGYFGAPVDYLNYSDDEIAQKGGRDDWQGKHDTNGDGEIDLVSEYVFGAAGNAAKRDRGATVATDFTQNTMDAFLAGRKIINDAAGAELTSAELDDLLAQRDIAVAGWEKAIAATVIHYINDTVADLRTVGTDDFSFTDLAKHWSEMKGFGLGLQFSPFSPFHAEANAGKFEQVQTLFQDAPVFDENAPADVTDYIADLLEARDIMEEVYGFDADNVVNW